MVKNDIAFALYTRVINLIIRVTFVWLESDAPNW